MPPRWILFAVIAVYSGSWIKLTIAADLLNTLPVASNGWRPIVGTSKVKPYVTIDQTVNQAPKQTISLTNDQDKDKNKNNNINNINNKGPHKPNGPGTNPVHINHHGSTGHHGVKPTKSVGVKLVGPGPVKTSGKPGVLLTKASPAPRHPVLGKLHAHLNHAKRHKPPQIRDEIMAPAPSSAIGSYAYFNQGPFQPGQMDFSNHFAFSNIHNDVLIPQQQPQPPQPFYKHPSQNELHPVPVFNYQDEYTRNLVPPPPHYKPQGETEGVNVEPSVQLHKYRQPEGFYQNGGPGFDLEITKEKFQEYHTTLAPSSFKPTTESFLDHSKYTKPKLISSSLSGYEVTENKDWTEQFPQYKPLFPTAKPKYSQIQYYQHDDTINAQFLPTPYNSDQVFPTSPTQAEVSSVYSEVSKKKKVKVPTTTMYNIKEVATHFPIYTNKFPAPTQVPQIPSQLPIVPSLPPSPSLPPQVSSLAPQLSSQGPSLSPPLQNHQQTYKEIEVPTEATTPREEIESTTRTTERTYPTRGSQSRRPMNRRRRPTRPTTTTTENSEQLEQGYNTEETVQSVETERPKMYRRRRPIKYRTTEPSREPIETTTRTIYRPRPTRVQPQTITEEVFVSKNHRHRPSYIQPTEDTITESEEKIYVSKNQRHRPAYFQTTEEPITEPDIAREPTSEQEPIRELEPEPTKELEHFQKPTRLVEYFQNPSIEGDRQEEATEMIKKRKRLRLSTTTEILPVTILNTPDNLIVSENAPENELDYTTLSAEPEEVVTIKNVYDFETEKVPTTITTTTTTTSTTTEPTTTKANRLRRPIKYDVQRPRFSVKDYRQRLNQYMSTTSSDIKQQSTESTPRIRYPSRFNKLSTTPETEETTEPTRQKFMPKEPRRKLGYTTENIETTSTEKYLRTMNPRLKQLTRFRPNTVTTEPSSTTTQKISIKPNIFNNLKRPQQLSLRNRIYNKRNITTTTEVITETPKLEENTEKNEVTIPFELAESKIEVTTQIYNEPTTEFTKNNLMVMNNDNDDDAFLQLQRISDLTSSAHKQYNTPGMFKSVAPTSRKVPSYFTIATEDPILPIEAFFPNLNQKEKQ